MTEPEKKPTAINSALEKIITLLTGVFGLASLVLAALLLLLGRVPDIPGVLPFPHYPFTIAAIIIGIAAIAVCFWVGIKITAQVTAGHHKTRQKKPKRNPFALVWQIVSSDSDDYVWSRTARQAAVVTATVCVILFIWRVTTSVNGIGRELNQLYCDTDPKEGSIVVLVSQFANAPNNRIEEDIYNRLNRLEPFKVSACLDYESFTLRPDVFKRMNEEKADLMIWGRYNSDDQSYSINLEFTKSVGHTNPDTINNDYSGMWNLSKNALDGVNLLGVYGASILLQNKNLTEARSLLDSALEEAKQSPLPSKLLAHAYFIQGQLWQNNTSPNYDTALEAFSQALHYDANYAVAYYNRAGIYFRFREDQNAYSDYNTLINLNSSDFYTARAYFDLLQHYMMHPNMKQETQTTITNGLAYFLHEKMAQPNIPSVYGNLGQMQLLAGECVDAKLTYEHLPNNTTDADRALLLANLQTIKLPFGGCKMPEITDILDKGLKYTRS